MAQISLYITHTLLNKLNAAAKNRHCSVSKFAASIISEKLSQEEEDEARKRRALKELRGALIDPDLTEPHEVFWVAETQRR